MACGGTTDEDKPIPTYPKSGCPPSHEMVDGVCTVKEVFFPGGTFAMGAGYCDRAGALEIPPDFTECPLRDQPRTVTVEPFYVDATVVTADGYPPGSGIECASRDLGCGRPLYQPSGVAFAPNIADEKKAVARTNKTCVKRGKRWLTEAEWEYIVTAGGTRKFPWGERAPRCSDANLDSTNCGTPNPSDGHDDISLVATYRPSPEGVYDLIGGFWEMLAPSPEVYGENYTAVPLNLPDCPAGPGKCEWPPQKVVTAARGGDRRTAPDAVDPVARRITHGINAGAYAFRCARSGE